MKVSYFSVFKTFFALVLMQYCSTAVAFTIIETPEEEQAAEDVLEEEELLPSVRITDTNLLDTQIDALNAALRTNFQNVQRGANPALRRGSGAGSGELSWGSWMTSSYTSFENDFSRTIFDGNTHLFLVGFDATTASDNLFGVAVSYERTDVDTQFNSGSQETDGLMIVPYFAWKLSDSWSIDGSFGSGEMDTTQFRTEPVGTFRLLPPEFSANIVLVSSATSSTRTFATVNLSGFVEFGDWSLGGLLGFLNTESDQDGYTESDGTVVAGGKSELEQSYIGGDIAYNTGASEIYLGLILEKDSSTTPVLFSSGVQPPDDDDSLVASLGWNYYGDAITGSVEYSNRSGKDDYSEDGLAFTLRLNY